jgi:hypothetical protein
MEDGKTIGIITGRTIGMKRIIIGRNNKTIYIYIVNIITRMVNIKNKYDGLWKMG